MPKVSVVMPVYNGEEYIKEAIDSIINQTFTDWEFIIVNEYGSNQATTDILAEYAELDSRIRVIQNEERLRIAESLNVGLRAAKGEYIARMDGDDVSMPERLQRQVEYLDAHLDIDLCGSYISDFSGNKLDWQIELDSEQINSDIMFFSPCVHPTIMFRTRLIKKMQIEYNSDFVASEDYDFFEQICSVGKITNLPRVLLCYRLHNNNATEKNRSIGSNLYKQVMARVFIKMGLILSADDLSLLSPHECMKGAQGKEILKRLLRLDQLLKKILLANEKKGLFSKKCLIHTFYKRMRDAKDSITWACQDIDWKVIDNFYNNSMFHHPWFVETDYQGTDTVLENPQVTVLLPTYNSEAYIADTIDSVLRQTYTNFEVLLINEYGSSDATLDFVNVFNDNRIRVIQNQQRLGLAESLNLGIREARGQYIARIDADDICAPERFAKQVNFLEKNPDYGLCGSWQHHFGADTDMVHEVPIEHAALQAQLLYRCELCHSTLMLRRSVFIDNNLFYNASCAAEDYELWTRAVYKTKFANLPEVLGEYRVGDTNITAKKIALLSDESAQICARLLQEHLDIKVSKDHLPFLSSWINEFNNIHNPQRLQKQLAMEKKLLYLMWNQNEKLRVYERSAFLYVINKRWRWVTNNWTYGTPLGEIFELDELLKKYPMPDNIVKSSLHLMRFYSYKVIKKILKIIFGPVYRPIKNRLNARFETLQRQIWDTEGHLKDNQAKMFNDLKLWQEQVVEENIEAIFDDKLRNVYEQINQKIDLKLSNAEQMINERMSNRIGEVERNIGQTIDRRVWQAEQNISQITDERIWQAEQNINQTTDGRIWQAEKNINQITDGRIWQAEKNINQTTDGRIWKAEKRIFKKVDTGFWNLHYELNKDNLFDNESKSQIYDEIFYWENRYGSVCSARSILGFILKRLSCNSMIDFGCGTGTWLWVALNYGVDEVMGIDGDYISRSILMIPDECFKPADLSKPLAVTKKYDMAMSLEVAEHLPAESADDFVAGICKSADIVLFSAAHPGQGGDGHINEQPKEYWLEKFAKHNYQPIEIKQYFADDEKVEWWYRDNIVLFAAVDKYEEVKSQIFSEK